jgi:arylsulfatase A-like enzyme/lysophospholipase L1-like esterase
MPKLRVAATLLLFVFVADQTMLQADETPNQLTIVAFGDSTTAPRDTVEQVYADRLPTLLQAKGIGATVINAGVGGSHSGRLTDNSHHNRRHALDRLDDTVRAHNPDIVIVQFGWNDSWIDSGLPDGPSRIPVEDYAANLRSIVTTLSGDSADVILMTPNRPNSSLEDWRVARTFKYVEAVRTLADSESLPLIDVWREYERLDEVEGSASNDLLLDNVHPNDAGHKLVAELLATKITEIHDLIPTLPLMTVQALRAARPCRVESASIKQQRPNIVLLVADDLGYSDLGCYGSEIRTPHIDRLAETGIRFTQFYNAARCCPSRACLLTGKYPHQAGVGHMTYDAGEPGYRGELNRDIPTIASVLHQAGYFTAMTGKWHVTPQTKPDSPQDNWPLQRGFDEFFGTLPGHGSLWDPVGLMRNNEPVDPEEGFFYTDAIADHAVQFIEQANDRPFFLYVPFTAPHYPLHARPETIDSYDDVYDIGWDEIRNRRYERLIERGFLPEGTLLAPRDPASIPWEEEAHQEWQAHRMQVFAAMITEMDVAIGRIIEELEQSGQFDNTLFVFLSDNGGSNEGHLYNTIERMEKPWTSSLIPETTFDGRPVRAGDWPDVPLGGPDTYGSYGPRWANVSNAPFRRHKSWVHEGGISTPCIMHWPDVIQYERTTHVIAHLIDLMPTFAAAANVNDIQSEGMSLIPLLQGPNESDAFTDREIGWEHEGNRAYRKGAWKIVSEFPGTWTTMYPYANEGRWELYNMESDRTELNNLADSNPEKLIQMIESYEKWADRVDVISWENLEGKQE